MKFVVALIFYSILPTLVGAEPCSVGSRSGLNAAISLRPLIENSCTRVRDSKACQDLAVQLKNSGIKPEDKLLRCDKTQSSLRTYETAWSYLSGCALGGWEFMSESFVSLGTALGEGAAKIVLEHRHEQAANAVCDLEPKAKIKLIQDYNQRVPKLLKMREPAPMALAKQSCASIRATLKKWRIQKANEAGGKITAKIMSQNFNYTPDEQEFINWGQGKTVSQNKFDLIKSAKNKLKQMGIELECYNSVQAAAMLCESISEVASLAVGGAAVAVKVAKLRNISKIAGLSEMKAGGTASSLKNASGNVKVGSEFKSGVIPVVDPSVAASFREKFGGESGLFFRGIRVPKGTPVQEFYVRSDGLGSMVSTKAEDAFHYGKSPAGLKTNTLSPDDEVVVMSYELKPYHIQEDPYGTLEHVFVDPNVNLKSAALKYKEIRIPAKDLEDPKALERYLRTLSQRGP